MEKLIIIGVAIFILLCAILIGVAAVVDISMGRQVSRERKQRRFLEKFTKRAQVRSLTGTVVGRKFKRDNYYVIIQVGQHTNLEFDDEHAYYVLKPNDRVEVYVREHFDANDKLFARVPIGIDFYD